MTSSIFLPPPAKSTTEDTNALLETRALFFDVDGTLLDRSGQLAQGAADAIYQARKNGHRVFLATGRALDDIPQTIWDIGFEGAVTNGGSTVDTFAGTLFQRVLTEDELARMVDYFEDIGAHFAIQSTGPTYRSPGFAAEVDKLQEAKILAGASPDDNFFSKWVSSFLPFDEADPTNLTKAVFNHPDPDLVEHARAHLGDLFDVVPGSTETSLGTSVEIGPLGVNKGSGIQVILDSIGLPASQAIGFGDSHNDTEMFDVCGFNVAMGDSEPVLMAQANLVTDPIAEGGIKNALASLNLI